MPESLIPRRLWRARGRERREPGIFPRVDSGHPSREAIMNTTATITSPETKPHALIASDRVEGTEVRRPSGEKIGTIERLMIDKISGHVAYAVLSFGGFLGVGAKHIPIPWGKLKFDPQIQSYQADISD